MYKILFQEFENELSTALASFLLWKKIHESTGNKKIVSAFNNTPTSWIIIRHSLQVTFFITLHRMFETGKEHASVEHLLSICLEEIDLFSKDELRNRKKPDILNNEDLEEYINKAYIPDEKDINILRGKLRKHRNTFNNIYRPIRNKIIAHNLLSHIDKSGELYEKTNIDEIESMLVFFNSLKQALYNLYHNGRKPDLTKYILDKSRYDKDYGKLISTITNV